MQNAFLEFFRNVFSLTILCLILTCSLFASPEKVLHNFISYPLGANPQGPLIADASGNLYGVAQFGGNHPFGVVFRLSKDSHGTWITTVLHSFEGGTTDGIGPEGGLTLDNAGNLYATTLLGGASGCGIVFQLSAGAHDKWTEKILYNFLASQNDGCWPVGTLAFDAAGNLYGRTVLGGSAEAGTVFKLTRSSNGWSESVLYQFSDTSGSPGGVILDNSGNLYGIDSGDVFQLVESHGAWVENILCSCDANGSLIMDTDGNLYGNSSFGAYGGVFELKHMKKGWNPITLYSFSGGSDGSQPWQGLTFDSTGNIYGVTQDGGKLGNCFDGFGCGTVFELIRSGSNHWTHKVLHTFMSDNDGEAPNTLLMDAAGTLYGTTMLGGDRYCTTDPDNSGCGTVFSLTHPANGQWKYRKVLVLAVGDGQKPQGQLSADSSGSLFGTAASGGAYNGGIVFELAQKSNRAWKETILHSFGGPHDGFAPAGNLLFDSSGSIYGVTTYNPFNDGYGFGKIFHLAPNQDGSWSEELLHSFTGYPKDGANPLAGLVADSSGNLYGTTAYGGSGRCADQSNSPIGCGTVFELSPSKNGGWSETILHVFTGYPSDGLLPDTTLLIDPEGNLYGSTAEGGEDSSCIDANFNFGCGSIFKLSSGAGGKWTESAYYSFSIASGTGVTPSGLTFDPTGKLYGAAINSGAYNGGTFYQVTTGSGGKWVVTPVFAFGSYKGDGLGPNNVTFDIIGNAFGTTSFGGKIVDYICFYGCGTVFELTSDSNGWTERLLHVFNGPFGDGMQPSAGIIFDPSGNLYGTTSGGGPDYGYTGDLGVVGGTVFEVTP